MNIHLNPIDQETKDTIERHKSLLLQHSDDFVQYIQHSEKSRKDKIRDVIYANKLKDFAVVETGQESKLKNNSSRKTVGMSRSINSKMNRP